MPFWATDFEKEAQLQLLTLYYSRISRSWSSWSVLFLQSALCLASHRQMQPLVFMVSSPQIKIETPPSSVKPIRLFSCLLKLPSFLPSISALSPCASLSVVQPTAFSHQKLTFPIIKVLARFPIFFTLFPPTLFRKENVNEQELKATHKPGEFVSDGQRDRGRWENVNSYISKKWHVLAFAH